jgi:small-conductance mechanosensitive channel/nucleotide-binding universal stress UspA family protein
MDLGWLEEPLLGPDILVEDVLIACGILLLGIILAVIFPRLISRNIGELFVRHQLKEIRKKRKKTKEELEIEKVHIRRRMKRTLEKPLRRSLAIAYLLLFFLLAIYSIDMGLDTDIEIVSRNYQAWQFLQMGMVLGILVIFVILAVDPILRALVYYLLSDSFSKAGKYSLFRALKFPTKLTIIILGFYITLLATFSLEDLEPFDWLTRSLVFILILLFSYLVAQLFVALTEPTFKGGDRTTRAASKVVGRLIKVGIYLIGALLGLTILGFDLVYIATSLGLIGFALAFGLQDTVANFAAGIMIALDKPFVIGDRIRIDWGGNQTWGDVKDISLRSTWIKTPEDEMIVVPNNVIASSQVWNYTRDSPKVALNVDIGISYDSDWKLSEKLILDILTKHPLVMNTPAPYVLMKEFGNSEQVLTIWFWIPEARDMLVIKSDIMKRIKDSFDLNGVEIPFPYRTLVYKSDIPKPKMLGEDYHSPVFLPSTGFKEFKVANGEAIELGIAGSTVLAPTSSSYPARYTAPYVMETAKRMGASVSALFIKTPGSNLADGQKALRIYNEIAKNYGVDIKLLFKEGDVLENILMAVEQENASIVIMGSTEESMFGSLTRRSVSQELLLHLNIPTMIIPFTKDVARSMERSEVEVDYDESSSSLGSIKALEDLEEKEKEKKDSIGGLLGA